MNTQDDYNNKIKLNWIYMKDWNEKCNNKIIILFLKENIYRSMILCRLEHIQYGEKRGNQYT